MRVAKPNELSTLAVPVLTARVSERELLKWFPVEFKEVNDHEETPEPSKAALVKLTRGPYVVVNWGETSNQLTLRISQSTNVATFVAALLREVPLPESRVLWRRPDVDIPSVHARKLLKVPQARRDRWTGHHAVRLRASRTARTSSAHRMSARKK
jgi:hypothetical protein